MATSTIIDPKKPKVGITSPPPTTYDFSQDAFTPQANKSGTAAAIGETAEQQMKDRVVAEAMSKPNTLITGAQMGSLPTGTGSVPVTFQAINQQNPEVEKVKPPQGTVYNPADKLIRDPLTGSIMTQSEGGYRFVSPETYAKMNPSGGQLSDTGDVDAADSFGTDSGMLEKFKSGIATYKKPDTSGIDQQISDLYGKLDTENSINDQLSREEEAARNEADSALRDIQREEENRNAQEFSELAGVGSGINPLSSGAGSVANRNKSVYEKMRANVIAQRDAKLSMARARASGAKTDAINAQIARLQDQQKGAKEEAMTEYTMRRQALSDAMDSMNAAARAAKEKRDLSKGEQDDARANLKMMFDMLGSRAFEGVSDEDLRGIEKSAGLPAGTIKVGLQTLKEQEIASKKKGEKNDFKFVGATKYQSAGYFNPTTGEFIPLKNAGTSGPPRGGGGGGTNISGLPDEAIRQYIEATGDYDLSKANLAAIQKVWNTRQTTPGTLPKGVYGPPTPTTENPFMTLKKTQLDTARQYRGTPDEFADIFGGGGDGGDFTTPSNTPSDNSDNEDELDSLINEMRSGL